MKLEDIQQFIEKHAGGFSEFQKKRAIELLAFSKVMEKVTWTITPSVHGPVSLMSKDPENLRKMDAIIKEQDEQKARRKEVGMAITREIAREYQQTSV